MKTCFVSGPYTAKSKAQILINIMNAHGLAARLWDMGFGVFCPHANTALMEERAPNTNYETYMEFDFQMIEILDSVLMSPGWEDSPGSRREHEYAQELGKPVFYNVHQAEKWLRQHSKTTS